jgi:CelD/BcsL family acetyltransferase involved in cellulose biosynthesis
VRVRVVSARELDAGLVARWRELLAAHPELQSPYFCPEFTCAVAAVRDDVHVGLLEEGNRVVGFFPFQRGPLRVGTPVGGQLSDYQAVVTAPETRWRADELLRGCGLALWDFDHLLASQAPFGPWHRVSSESPIMDLSDGWEGYRRRRKCLGLSRVTQTLRKRRKLEREVGPVRFEPDVRDPAVLQRVLDWKSEQCRRSEVFDFFSLDWTVALVRRIAETATPDFAGSLSVLWVGERVAAAHFGMRSRSVWHWWFPGYEHDLGRYSPGSILLLEVAQCAPGLGVHCIDLGKGDDAYKASFQTGAVALAEGSVRLPSLASTLRALREGAERFVRASPLAAPLRVPARAVARSLRAVRAH